MRSLKLCRTESAFVEAVAGEDFRFVPTHCGSTRVYRLDSERALLLQVLLEPRHELR